MNTIRTGRGRFLHDPALMRVTASWHLQVWFRMPWCESVADARGLSTPRRSMGLLECYHRAQYAGEPILGLEEHETWLPRFLRYERPCVESRASNSHAYWMGVAADHPHHEVHALSALAIAHEAGVS